MTTIIYKNKALYGDRKILTERGRGLYYAGDRTKIFLHPSKQMAYGISGTTAMDADEAEAILYENLIKAVNKDWPNWKRVLNKVSGGEGIHVIFMMKHDIFVVDNKHSSPTSVVIDEYYAIGSGRGHAVPLLDMDVDIAKVYDIVSTFDGATSVQFDTISMSELLPIEGVK